MGRSANAGRARWSGLGRERWEWAGPRTLLVAGRRTLELAGLRTLGLGWAAHAGLGWSAHAGVVWAANAKQDPGINPWSWLRRQSPIHFPIQTEENRDPKSQNTIASNPILHHPKIGSTKEPPKHTILGGGGGGGGGGGVVGERKIVKDEKSDSARKWRGMEELPEHLRKQHRVLLQNLR
ncbi:hypothetical protein SDJN03_24053, partial [Cucurbita argyrosperma subsp. sororia]